MNTTDSPKDMKTSTTSHTQMTDTIITRPFNIDPRPQRNKSCELYENDQLTRNSPNSNDFNRTQNISDCSVRLNNLGENCTKPSVNNIFSNKHVPPFTNVKIVGLNVCGLPSKFKYKIFEGFAKKFDILCLSETKIDHIDLTGTILNGEYSCFIKEKTVNTH